jgi:hypothetical protein
MAARPEVVALSTDFDLQRTGFGQMWAASMMLNHLGGTASAEEFTQAVLRPCGHVEDVSADGRGTADWYAG